MRQNNIPKIASIRPLAYAGQFYVLRDHIRFVRDRHASNACRV
jgi:hypothetical protein